MAQCTSQMRNSFLVGRIHEGGGHVGAHNPDTDGLSNPNGRIPRARLTSIVASIRIASGRMSSRAPLVATLFPMSRRMVSEDPTEISPRETRSSSESSSFFSRGMRTNEALLACRRNGEKDAKPSAEGTEDVRAHILWVVILSPWKGSCGSNPFPFPMLYEECVLHHRA